MSHFPCVLDLSRISFSSSHNLHSSGLVFIISVATVHISLNSPRPPQPFPVPVANHVRIVALDSLFTTRRHRLSRLLTLLKIHRRRQLPSRSGDRRGWRLTRRPLQLASNTNRRPQRRCRLPIPRLPQFLHDDHFSAFTRMGDRHSFVAPARRDELSAGRGESRDSGYRAACQPE